MNNLALSQENIARCINQYLKESPLVDNDDNLWLIWPADASGFVLVSPKTGALTKEETKKWLNDNS